MAIKLLSRNSLIISSLLVISVVLAILVVLQIRHDAEKRLQLKATFHAGIGRAIEQKDIAAIAALVTTALQLLPDDPDLLGYQRTLKDLQDQDAAIKETERQLSKAEQAKREALLAQLRRQRAGLEAQLLAMGDQARLASAALLKQQTDLEAQIKDLQASLKAAKPVATVPPALEEYRSDSSVLIQEAERAMYEGNGQLAKRTLEEVLAYEPQNPRGNLVLAHLLLKEDPTSKQYLRKILILCDRADGGGEPTLESRQVRAEVAANLGQTDVAIAQYQDLVERVPNSQEVLLALCDLYEKTMRWDELAKTANQLLGLNPNQDLAYYYRSLSAEKMGDWSGALSAINQALELRPKHSGYLDRAGSLAVRQEQWQMAIDYYTRLSAVGGTYETNLAIGQCYERLGKVVEATRFYERAIDANALNSKVDVEMQQRTYAKLASFRITDKKYDDASWLITQGEKLPPKSEDLQLAKADLALAKGDLTTGYAAYQSLALAGGRLMIVAGIKALTIAGQALKGADAVTLANQLVPKAPEHYGVFVAALSIVAVQPVGTLAGVLAYSGTQLANDDLDRLSHSATRFKEINLFQSWITNRLLKYPDQATLLSSYQPVTEHQ